MTTGTRVSITGARNFTGRVLVATDTAMIVAIDIDRSVTLRRDPASTNPDQWRYGGLPVGVQAIVDMPEFRARLARLERETRPDYIHPSDYIDPEEGRD